MKCIFMYNPKSGKGKVISHLKYIKETLKMKFSEVVIYETKSSLDTIEMSKKACYLYDAIIFSGGDGTFNDVTCGVASQKIRPVLGYIPSGTVNDIARNLKIPTNIKKALKIIMNGETIHHDVGVINDTYFMYVAAIGTFTGVSYRTKQDVKKIFGKIAYAFDGLRDLLNPTLSKITLEINGEKKEFDTPLFLVMNSKSIAGIPFNKKGYLNDGKFDIIIVKKGIYKGVFNILRLFILGVLKLRRLKCTSVYRAGEFTVTVDGNPIWTIDGEAGPKGSVKIKNLHNYLQIYIPKRKNKKTKSKSFN